MNYNVTPTETICVFFPKVTSSDGTKHQEQPTTANEALSSSQPTTANEAPSSSPEDSSSSETILSPPPNMPRPCCMPHPHCHPCIHHCQEPKTSSDTINKNIQTHVHTQAQEW